MLVCQHTCISETSPQWQLIPFPSRHRSEYMRQECTRDPEGTCKIWWRYWARNKVTIEHFLRSPWAPNTVLSKIYTSLDPVWPACRQECCSSVKGPNIPWKGKYMSQSHEISRNWGHSSCPYLWFQGEKQVKTFPLQKLIQLVNLGNYHKAYISLKVYLEGWKHSSVYASFEQNPRFHPQHQHRGNIFKRH